MPSDPTPGRVRVEDVSVVLLAHEGGHGPDDERLTALLDAVAAQDLRPRRVLVAGVAADRDLAAQLSLHDITTVHRVPLLTTGATDLDRARSALPVHPEHWVWVLTPGTLPAPGALAALAAAVRRSSRVGVVGPKLVRAEDPRLLLALGHHLTVAGRPADTHAPGLVDQGQHDLRQDVLGVPLPGSLVRSDVLEAVGGVDPAFAADGVAGLDLGWRAQLAGHRVVVAPDAVVRVAAGPAGDDPLGVRDPRRTRLRQRQVALARGSVWAAPWRALGVLVTSVAATLVLLLVKRPREAADEWADARAVLSPVRGWGARWRFRRRRAVRPRDLAALFLPAATGWRATVDTVHEALDPRDRRARRSTAGHGGLESGPVSEELADLGSVAPRRRWSWPAALSGLLVVVLTAWWWRDLGGALAPGGWGVEGEQLGVAPGGAPGAWHSFVDAWRGGGLGRAEPAEPWLLPVSGAAALLGLLPGAGDGTVGVALAWTLLLAPLLALVTSSLALRRVTSRRWLRAGLGLAWAGAPPLAAAAADGRVGPVLVHVLAPLLVVGYAVAADRRGGTRRTAAAFATVLGVAVAGAWVPLVLMPATVGGLLVVLLGRRAARWRGLVLALLPWGLLGPWLVPVLLDHPVRLLGGAGATQVVAGAGEGLDPVPAWQTLLLGVSPADPQRWQALPLWLVLPLWLAALAALLLPGRRGRRAGLLVAGALLTLSGAVVVGRVALGHLGADWEAPAGASVVAWPGTLVSLGGAGLLLAAGLALDHLLQQGRPGAARWLAPGAVAVAVLAPAALVAAPLLTGPGPAASLAEAHPPLPPVAAEQATGPAGQRTLLLEGAGGDGPVAGGRTLVRAELVGAELEPTRVLPDRTRDLVTPAPDLGPVEPLTQALLGQAPPELARERMIGLGVGYVLLLGTAEDPLAIRVDRAPGLTRVSSPPDRVLWRLSDNDAARLAVVDAAGEVWGRVGMTGPHGRGSSGLADLPAGARLTVAEGQGWGGHATVSVDGEEVRPADDGSYALPAGTHDVDVEVRPARPWWALAALALAVVVAFLALPVGRAEAPDEEDRR